MYLTKRVNDGKTSYIKSKPKLAKHLLMSSGLKRLISRGLIPLAAIGFALSTTTAAHAQLPPLLPATCGDILADGYLLDGMGIGTEARYRLASGSATHDPDVFFGPTGTEHGYTKNADGSIDFFFDGEAAVANVSTTVGNASFSSLSTINGKAENQSDAAEFWRITARLEGVPGETYNFNISHGDPLEFFSYWAEDTSGTVMQSSLGQANSANGWFYGNNDPNKSTTSSGGATSISGQEFIPVSYTISPTNTDGIVYLTIMVMDPQANWGPIDIDYEFCPAPSLTMTKVANSEGPHMAGDVVTYTYTVKNDGNRVINNVAITDTHNGSDPAPTPGDETLLTDIAPIGDSTDATAADGNWDVLAPGDTLTFKGTYTITQDDVEDL